jgi:hypothetical protein
MHQAHIRSLGSLGDTTKNSLRSRLGLALEPMETQFPDSSIPAAYPVICFCIFTASSLAEGSVRLTQGGTAECSDEENEIAVSRSPLP